MALVGAGTVQVEVQTRSWGLELGVGGEGMGGGIEDLELRDGSALSFQLLPGFQLKRRDLDLVWGSSALGSEFGSIEVYQCGVKMVRFGFLRVHYTTTRRRFCCAYLRQWMSRDCKLQAAKLKPGFKVAGVWVQATRSG